MSLDDALIVAPDPRKHRDELFDLLAKTFSHGGYFAFRDYCRTSYMTHSRYDWGASRICIVRGRIVAHCGVWEYQMRIGSARVRTGGIGVVGTHADYRRLGLMARVMPATIQAMRQAGYHMTVLFGIQNFYHRFGYVRAWPRVVHTVSVSDLPEGSPPAGLRRFAPRSREDLDSLYNRYYSRMTGTAVRPTYLRSRRKWHGVLWTGRGRKPTGYVLLERDSGTLICPEAAGEPGEVLAVLGALARRWFCREVRFDLLPYPHPLAKLLRRGSCRVEATYSRSGGPMIRTVSLAGVLERLAGELTRRLRASHLAAWRGKLLVRDAESQVLLIVGPRGVHVEPGGSSGADRPIRAARHAIRGGHDVARLLIGGEEPQDIVRSAGIRLSGDAAKLLPVLLPNQHPILSAWDTF